jgi:DNA polymerase-3 subunit gamma/tau
VVDEGEVEEIVRPLNSRERFERIAEQYPLVRELKEKLQLEIMST